MDFQTKLAYEDDAGRTWQFRKDLSMKDWEEMKSLYPDDHQDTHPLFIERFRVVKQLVYEVWDDDLVLYGYQIPWDEVPARTITEIYDLVDTGDIPFSQMARMQEITDALTQMNNSGQSDSPPQTTQE